MRFLALSLLFFTITFVIHAQSEETETWPIVERCVSEPTTPPDDWFFEGYIAFYNKDGIHAIRHDLDTPYYLAFNRPDQFVQYASFSPDGQWLSIPSGYEGRANWSEQFYNITENRIYSTDLDRKLVHRVPRDFVFRSSGAFYPWSIGEWRTNDSFDVSLGSDYFNMGYQRIIIDHDSFKVVELPEIEATPQENYTIALVIIGENYDGEIGINDTFYLENNLMVFADMPFYTPYRRNQYIEFQNVEATTSQNVTNSNDIVIRGQFSPSPNRRYMVFEASLDTISEKPDYNLFLLDLQAQQIIDLCIPLGANINAEQSVGRWSPNSNQILIGNLSYNTLENYDSLHIIDFEENAHYQVPYHFEGYILGWYP